MLMLIIYIAAAGYLVSKAKKKKIAAMYAFLAFLCGYILFALIGYVLVEVGIIEYRPWYEDPDAYKKYQIERFILGTLQIAFSLYILERILAPENELKFAKRPKALFSKIKKLFHSTIQWRLFIVLQVIGVFVVVYVDITNIHGWNFLPDILDYRNRLTFEWSFLHSRYWTRYQENWIGLISAIGPFLITKSIFWVRDGRNEKT